MTACMGGWCIRREKCTHYRADSAEIAERLCQPGEANAFSPIKEIIVTKQVDAAPVADERLRTSLDVVERAIDSSGQTLFQLMVRIGRCSESSMHRWLTLLHQEGRAFHARVPKKMLGVGMFGVTYVWFRTQEEATAKQEEARRFSQRCTLLRNQAKNQRNAMKSKRHANQKPLTVAGGLSKRKPTQKQADTAQRLERIRHQEAAAFRTKGDNTPAVPPPGKSIQELPGYTGRTRYTVDGPVTGPFSSLPPGQYAFEAVSAAARAAV